MTGRRSRPSLLPAIIGLSAAATILWSLGLIWFTLTAMRSPPVEMPRADGIVVLTGGARRLDAALSLLRDGHAEAMLVSGVSEQSSLSDLARASGLDVPSALATHIALGHSATTTIGNALETASWARTNDFHSLIIVTAGYHMRRAMAEIGTALPDVLLVPYPVRSPALGHVRLSTFRLLATEYTKWLAVEVGLTGSAHLREIA